MEFPENPLKRPWHTPVLEGLDPEAQEILLQFIGKVVSKMPQEMGLKLFDDLREIAEACYRIGPYVHPDKSKLN